MWLPLPSVCFSIMLPHSNSWWCMARSEWCGKEYGGSRIVLNEWSTFQFFYFIQKNNSMIPVRQLSWESWEAQVLISRLTNNFLHHSQKIRIFMAYLIFCTLNKSTIIYLFLNQWNKVKCQDVVKGMRRVTYMSRLNIIKTFLCRLIICHLKFKFTGLR